MLRISSNDQGTFKKDPWFIASSEASPYIPISAHYSRESTHVGTKRIYTYHKPRLSHHSDRNLSSFQVDYLYEYLNFCQSNYEMFIDKERLIRIKVLKGCIYDMHNNLLLMMSCKSGKSINYSRNSNVLTKEHGKNLFLFLSNNLVFNSAYAPLYKELQEDYISKASEIDIPVIILSSEKIDKLHYSNDFEIKFNKIDDLQYHLNNVVGSILKKSEYDFQSFHPGIVPERIIEVIPEPVIEQPDVIEIAEYVPAPPIPDRTEAIINSLQEATEQMLAAGSPTDRYVAGFDPSSNDSLPVVSYIIDGEQVSGYSSVRTRIARNADVIAEYPTTRLTGEEYFNLAYGNPILPITPDQPGIGVLNTGWRSNLRERINLIDDTEDELFTDSGDTELAPF